MNKTMLSKISDSITKLNRRRNIALIMTCLFSVGGVAEPNIANLFHREPKQILVSSVAQTINDKQFTMQQVLHNAFISEYAYIHYGVTPPHIHWNTKEQITLDQHAISSLMYYSQLFEANNVSVIPFITGSFLQRINNTLPKQDQLHFVYNKKSNTLNINRRHTGHIEIIHNSIPNAKFSIANWLVEFLAGLGLVSVLVFNKNIKLLSVEKDSIEASEKEYWQKCRARYNFSVRTGRWLPENI